MLVALEAGGVEVPPPLLPAHPPLLPLLVEVEAGVVEVAPLVVLAVEHRAATHNLTQVALVDPEGTVFRRQEAKGDLSHLVVLKDQIQEASVPQAASFNLRQQQ